LRALDAPFQIGTTSHRIGAGVGIALIPDDTDSDEEAMREADIALYRAKAERRSAFRFFEDGMDQLVRERELLERDLRGALDEGRIEVRYRPATDLRSGAVVSFEATPLWRAADGTEMTAERLLPLAEETGLVHALAKATLQQACTAAKAWPADILLCVDLFPGQLKDTNLVATILGICRETGFDPRRLEIEIAESLIVRDLEAARRVLVPLRAAGVRIGLDHFGTGYSNLLHMQELQLDRVKIDRRFVENMGEAEASRVVRALAGLGAGLGMSVVADGVEGGTRTAPLLDSGIAIGQTASSRMTAAEAAALV
jgi:predicted signal transduction protein with EAL and GGDEF domain